MTGAGRGPASAEARRRSWACPGSRSRRPRGSRRPARPPSVAGIEQHGHVADAHGGARQQRHLAVDGLPVHEGAVGRVEVGQEPGLLAALQLGVRRAHALFAEDEVVVVRTPDVDHRRADRKSLPAEAAIPNQDGGEGRRGGGTRREGRDHRGNPVDRVEQPVGRARRRSGRNRRGLRIEAEIDWPEPQDVAPLQDQAPIDGHAVDQGAVGAGVLEDVTLRTVLDECMPAGDIRGFDHDVARGVAPEDQRALADLVFAAVGEAHQSTAGHRAGWMRHGFGRYCGSQGVQGRRVGHLGRADAAFVHHDQLDGAELHLVAVQQRHRVGTQPHAIDDHDRIGIGAPDRGAAAGGLHQRVALEDPRAFKAHRRHGRGPEDGFTCGERPAAATELKLDHRPRSVHVRGKENLPRRRAEAQGSHGLASPFTPPSLPGGGLSAPRVAAGRAVRRAPAPPAGRGDCRVHGFPRGGRQGFHPRAGRC